MDWLVLEDTYEFHNPGRNGLGLIGGDTVNFLALGGCLPESSFSFFSPFWRTGIDLVFRLC